MRKLCCGIRILLDTVFQGINEIINQTSFYELRWNKYWDMLEYIYIH